MPRKLTSGAILQNRLKYQIKCILFNLLSYLPDKNFKKVEIETNSTEDFHVIFSRKRHLCQAKKQNNLSAFHFKEIFKHFFSNFYREGALFYLYLGFRVEHPISIRLIHCIRKNCKKHHRNLLHEINSTLNSQYKHQFVSKIIIEEKDDEFLNSRNLEYIMDFIKDIRIDEARNEIINLYGVIIDKSDGGQLTRSELAKYFRNLEKKYKLRHFSSIKRTNRYYNEKQNKIISLLEKQDKRLEFLDKTKYFKANG